jgi:hypothetical protein
MRARGERREWMRGERAISACVRQRCPLIAKVLGEKEEIGRCLKGADHFLQKKRGRESTAT